MGEHTAENDAPLCGLCDEPLAVGDDVHPLGGVPSGKAHRECLLRNAVGGIGHHEDHALWCIERGDPDGGRTYRASALEVDALYATRVIPPGRRTLAEIEADSERMADEADARHVTPPGEGNADG